MTPAPDPALHRPRDQVKRSANPPSTYTDVTVTSTAPGLASHLSSHLVSHLSSPDETPVPATGPHLMVRGDNLAALDLPALAALSATVDCVYLDPPYNTGGTNFDRYDDTFDEYLDEWVDFMRPRIEAAHRLLNRLGVVMVAIGDDEHHRLRVLLDEVFGAQNFVSNVVWHGSVRSDSRWVSNGAEYMLIYARDRYALKTSGIKWREPKPGVEEMLTAAAACWTRSGGEADPNPEEATRLMKAWQAALPKTHLARSKGLADYNKIDERGDVYRYGPIAKPVMGKYHYAVAHPVTGRPVPTPANGWRMPEERMAEAIDLGNVVFGADETTPARTKLRLREQATQVPRNVFESRRSRGAAHLKTLLGADAADRFPYPKDHEVLGRWIDMATPADGVVVDLFGGSGSTLEAVLRLNAADGGTRRCVLVTNNEVSESTGADLAERGLTPGAPDWESHGVFEHVTVPRVTSVLTGARPDGTTHTDTVAGLVEITRLG